MQFNNKHTANKEKLKKTNVVNPFFANLNIISSKKIISKHFKKIHKFTMFCSSIPQKYII